ncbi:MAG: hypothetical protein IPG34_19535 [Rhodocyclaceae bacterium]|nr:hypothetical protein [Rhodocyclaceae bacterium]
MNQQIWIELTNLIATAGPSILNSVADMFLRIAAHVPSALTKVVDLIVLAVDEMVGAIYNLLGTGTEEVRRSRQQRKWRRPGPG